MNKGKPTQGIVISIYGNRGYGFMAYNLAYSIKHLCKDYPVFLFTDEQAVSHLFPESKTVFDSITILSDKDYKMDGQPDPATMKIRLLFNSPFDETLYLDADTICVSDIKPLMEKLSNSEGFFYTDIQGSGKRGDDIKYDAWGKHDVVYPFFGLNNDDTFYSTNSSWMYFKKGERLEELKGWMIHYLQKRYPLTELKNKWIKGRLPDELLWSGVISKMKIDASGFKPMYYGNTYDSSVDIMAKYQFITYYGRIGSGVNLVNPMWLDFMERHMKMIHMENAEKHLYKMDFCYKDKALNQ